MDARVEFCQALARTGISADEISDGLAQAVAEVVLDFCIFHLVSDDGQTMELQAAYHPHPVVREALHRMYESTPPTTRQGISGRVLSTAEPYFQPRWTGDAEDDEQISETHRSHSDLNVHSFIVAPMCATNGAVIGTLTVGRQNTFASYNQVDVDLLEFIAAQAAMKIETLRLCEEYKKICRGLHRAVRGGTDTVVADFCKLRVPLSVVQTQVETMQHYLNDQDTTSPMDVLLKTTLMRLDQQVARMLKLVDAVTDYGGQ